MSSYPYPPPVAAAKDSDDDDQHPQPAAQPQPVQPADPAQGVHIQQQQQQPTSQHEGQSQSSAADDKVGEPVGAPPAVQPVPAAQAQQHPVQPVQSVPPVQPLQAQHSQQPPVQQPLQSYPAYASHYAPYSGAAAPQTAPQQSYDYSYGGAVGAPVGGQQQQQQQHYLPYQRQQQVQQQTQQQQGQPQQQPQQTPPQQQIQQPQQSVAAPQPAAPQPATAPQPQSAPQHSPAAPYLATYAGYYTQPQQYQQYTGYAAAPAAAAASYGRGYNASQPGYPLYGQPFSQQTMAFPAGSGSGSLLVPRRSTSRRSHGGRGLDEPLSPSVGQVQPRGLRPKISTIMWEDEKTMCYQVDANGVSVVRRADNDMINGTKLLNVAKMTRGRRDGILKAEKTRHVVKIGSMHLKGVWIPFDRALLMAQREGIVDLLYPLFVKDIKRVIRQGTPVFRGQESPEEAQVAQVSQAAQVSQMPQAAQVSQVPQVSQVAQSLDSDRLTNYPPSASQQMMFPYYQGDASQAAATQSQGAYYYGTGGQPYYGSYAVRQYEQDKH